MCHWLRDITLSSDEYRTHNRGTIVFSLLTTKVISSKFAYNIKLEIVVYMKSKEFKMIYWF